MKTWLIYIIIGALLAGGGVTYFVLRDSDSGDKDTDTQSQAQDETIVATEETDTTADVPDPTEEDIIRNLYQLISDGDISGAVLSMSERNISDDSVKQAWGVQFAAYNMVSVVSIDPVLQTDWTATKHSYQVVLDMLMDPGSADEAIPYYGYENGQNTRYVTIVSEDSLWKVDAISTGP